MRALGVPAPSADPVLAIPPSHRERAATILDAAGIRGRPYVAVSAGAAFGGAKRWPARGFAEAAGQLARDADREVVLLGSPSERPIALEVARGLESPPVDLVGRISLVEALSILGGADLLLTNDSGLMHAGAALEVPLVAVFGPTDSVATGPRGAASRVVREPTSCAPCFLRECPIDHRCMTRVSSGTVVRAAREVVA